MEARIIVSGERGIAAYAVPPDEMLVSYGAGGADAVCAGRNGLYAADNREQTICRYDLETLLPMHVFCGGPGITQMMLSRDERYLYALCAEADSLIMLCAHSGTPKLLCRAGVNPCAMAMDESGRFLAVAGGASGDVFLLDAHSLSLCRRFPTCGMVFSVAILEKHVYALSLTETMDTVLTVFTQGRSERKIPLPGMPGALCIVPEYIIAATHCGLFFLPHGESSILSHIAVPGRAGRLWTLPEGLLMTDLWSEALFWREKGLRGWRRVSHSIRDVSVLKLFD